MTFQDVPVNLSSLSLRDDRALADDVVDLFCPEDARRGGAIAILLCDDQARLLQPILVDEVPSNVPASEFASFLGHMLQVPGPGSSAIVAICHPGDQITDSDRERHQLAIEQCRSLDVHLIGTYVVAPNQIIRLPDPIDANA